MNKSNTESVLSDHEIIETLRKQYDGITYYPKYSHLNIINAAIAQLPESIREEEDDDIYDYSNDDHYEPWRRDDSWEDSNDLKKLTDDEKIFSYYNLKFNITENKEEFYKYYEKFPLILAQQYIQDPKSLTKDERERLAWEGSFREREILEMNVQSDDSILCEINKRLTLEFPNNKGLKLMK